MAKIAALFGGQGSQYQGMGRSLREEFPVVRQIYECGSDILGFDLARISDEGSDEELARTAICQPVIFAHAVAAYLAARDRLPGMDAVAGHSLGEYAALCCAGVYPVEDGFRIIGARAAVMEEAARSAPGAMVAVSGAAEAVREVCGRHERVWAVNFNTPSQTVISGETAQCLAAAEELAAGGARATRLCVDSAFHTPMMANAAAQLKERLGSIAFCAPAIDFYSNVTGGHHTPEDCAAYFAEHMVSPVRFVEEVAAMVAGGVDTCVEFGPKKTAATLAKKNSRSLTVMNVEDGESLRGTVANLSEAQSK